MTDTKLESFQFQFDMISRTDDREPNIAHYEFLFRDELMLAEDNGDNEEGYVKVRIFFDYDTNIEARFYRGNLMHDIQTQVEANDLPIDNLQLASLALDELSTMLQDIDTEITQIGSAQLAVDENDVPVDSFMETTNYTYKVIHDFA